MYTKAENRLQNNINSSAQLKFMCEAVQSTFLATHLKKFTFFFKDFTLHF